MRWLAEVFKERVQERPQFKVSEMKMKVERVWKVHVSIHKCKRAKRIITQELDGSYDDEYAKLDAFCEELRASNPGTDAWTELNQEELRKEKRVFKRMYLCFNASKVNEYFPFSFCFMVLMFMSANL